ncbi:MAG TPA: MT-A70 family methyltransferase [Rhizomicrobium sp.]|jgi:N6-adenosine-specific RNA methylase IME4|nr:MT-A70 family methyltransferase [Rhizomicrobium sp.]
MRETLGFHPLANVFPLIEGPAFDDLVADVKQHGIRNKIWLFEGLILDGRNRYRAGEAADVDVTPLETFHGTYREALDFVISENLHRRHMTDGQRQSVAARISTLTPGRPSDETPPIGGISVADAARMLNVKPRSVERAKQVQRDATPELAAAMERGLIAVDMAAQAAKLTPAFQMQIAQQAESGAVRVLRTILKRASRTAREQSLGAKQTALPTKKYGVILADPEWRFEVYNEQTGQDRAAANHYPTSTTDDIAARPVGDIAADDCLLLLWATNPMLPDALRVVQAWGFKFKSMRTWVKDIVAIDVPANFALALELKGRVFAEVGPAGTGFWNRDRSEHLIIATRGHVPAPSMGTQGESVIFAARPHLAESERDRHSAKPPDVHEWVEEHFPNLPRIELNARGARRGWDAWGNEAPVKGASSHDPDTGEVFDGQNAVTVAGSAGREPDRNDSEVGNTSTVVTGGESAATPEGEERDGPPCLGGLWVGGKFKPFGPSTARKVSDVLVLQDAAPIPTSAAPTPPRPAVAKREPNEIPAFLLRTNPKPEAAD